MSTTHEPTPLEMSLQELEQILETPIVSGDLVHWLKNVCDLICQLKDVLQKQIEVYHPQSFARIENDQPELLPRIEKLKVEDSKLLTSLHEHQRDFTHLYEMAVLAEPDEFKVEQHVNPEIDELLRFIIDVRKQERALSTWLREAELRDNGTAG